MMEKLLFAFIKFLFIILGICFILIFLLLIKECYDDKHKPTEFFKIEEGWHDEARRRKFEIFVLSNPPNDSSLLRKMVEEYNFRTMSVDTIKKYFPYEVRYYRETKCLTRNYEEGKPYQACFCGEPFLTEYPGQRIRNHEKLMEINYYSYRDGSYSYQYRFGRYFGDTEYKDIDIKDIDQFFEEGRKKLEE